MIIKRWDGNAFVEEHPKTKAQLIFNAANDTAIFDAFDKIKANFLPDTVFDGLTYGGTVSAALSASLFVDFVGATLAAAQSGLLGAPIKGKGYYWVISATGTIAKQSTAVAGTTNTDIFARWEFRNAEGTAETGGLTTGSGVLEVGDWIVIDSISGMGDSANPYVITFSAVNNTYENATTAIDGIVRLSNQGTYANLAGNNVVTDGVLKTVIDNAAFAAGNHVHGNILNNGTITTNTAAGSGQHLVVTSTGNLIQQSAIELGTATTTFLRNDGAWGTPVGTTYGKATTTALGLVEVAYADLGSNPTITATTNSDRYYGVQLNQNQQMVVNVPWSDTNTTYSKATATTLGLVELFSDTVQSTAANTVTTTASRTYGVQLNAADQAVVNVPWTDTVYSLPQATTGALGGVRLGVAAAAATVQGASTTAGRFYHVGAQADGSMYVNVPWVDTNTTYSVATATALGLVELFSNTQQSVAANAVSATASRTYGLQLNSDNQGVINVPWTDTVATATALGGLTATSNSFQMVHPFFVQADAPATPLAGTIWFDL